MMHVTQTIIGGIAVVGAFQLFAINPLLNRINPPQPIVVHSLEWRDGIVVQERTVTTDGPFVAVWSSEIRNANTGEIVPHCYGTGVWPYEPGHRSPQIPLAEWVGNPACQLDPGRYQAIATYEAGRFRETARSPVFTVEGDG